MFDEVIATQFTDDVVSLSVRVGIDRVRDLECELSQGETEIFGAGANPNDPCIGWWPVGAHPEAGICDSSACAKLNARIECDGVAGAAIDRLLEAISWPRPNR